MSRRSFGARVDCSLAGLQQLNAIVVFIFIFISLLFSISPTNCKEADHLVKATTLSSANFTGKPSAAAAAAVTVDGKDAATERLRLDISPQPNDNGELVKAVGSSVVFTCYRVTADDDSDDDLSAEATTIAWLDKNDIVIPSHTNHSRGMYTEYLTPSVTKLYISETHNKHAGPYTCVEFDQLQRRAAERTVTLLLYRDIEFDEIPGLVSTVLGASVLLPCVVRGQPPPVISWRFGPHKITSGGRYDQRHDGLHIRNITSSDEGVYYCQAVVVSSGMFKEQPVTLKLLDGPSYSSSERVKSLTGTEGQQLIIDCAALGSQPISYEFFKDGLPVTSDDRVIANTRSGQLKITSLTQYDVGKYLCIASNTVGRMTAERIINVHSKPVIGELQSIIEARGMSATLLCRSHGNPPPIVTFQRVQPFKNTTYRSGQLYEGGRVEVRDVIPGCTELIISYVRVSDAGVYKCQTLNSVGEDSQTATIEVGYEPEFVSRVNQVLYVYRDDNQTTHYNLTCIVDGRPAPRLYWTRHHHHQQQQQQQQQQLHSNDTFRVFHLNSTVTVLQISVPPANYEASMDWLFGVYTCHASNFFGHNYLMWELREAVVPDKPTAVRVVKCLTTSVQLDVVLPRHVEGPRITGFVIHNELQVIHANLGEEIWLSGLRPSTVYLINVAAVNMVGAGQPLQFAFTTDNLRPSAVRSVTVRPSSQSSSGYTVSWHSPHDGGMPIRKYLLRYRQVRRIHQSDTAWRPVNGWTSVSILQTTDTGADNHSYIVDDLAVNSYYQLEVRALNDLDCSPPFRPPFIFFTNPDRSTSTSWSSEGAVVSHTSMFVSSFAQRHHVTVTSWCFALTMSSLISGDSTAVIRLFGVVIFFSVCSISELRIPACVHGFAL